MNILILNWKDIKHPQVGGAEIIVFELAKRLVTDGHNVTWFCRSFKRGIANEQADGINIIRRGNLCSMYLHAPMYYWGLSRKPELVIDISNTIYWQSPLWALKSKKIAYLNQLGQDVFFYEFPLAISRFGMFLERLQYLTYSHTPFICYSPSTKQDLVSMGIPASNISLFSLGLDHSRYQPGKKSKDPLFVCVNRLVKMKRTDLAIKAMAIVAKKYPLCKLAVLGTGYHQPYLETLSHKLNLENNVIFVDKDTWFFSKNIKDRKINLMQKAWALVFPSVKEGWGMTVTECAACGTPAIVSDVSGLKDSVVRDQTGLVLSPNPGPGEIATAMIKLIEHPELRERLSKQAIVHSRKFTWEASYTQFKKIITRL